MKDGVTTTISFNGGPAIPFDADKIKQHLEQELGGKRKGPKMKADPDFKAAADHAYSVTADELLNFIERVEELQAEAKDIAEQIKEVFAESKGRGYDNATIRKIIALRKKKPEKRAEEQAILDTYRAALGME